MDYPIERLAYSISEALAATGMSRNKIYQAIGRGELRSFKNGRRRMISVDALREYIRTRELATQQGQRS
jgi:excisionase family DNA binding protein